MKENEFPGDSRESLFRFFDSVGGIETLKNKKLRFKTACQFNDPYDLNPDSFLPDIDFSSMKDEDCLDVMLKIKVEPLSSMFKLLVENGAEKELINEIKPLLITGASEYLVKSRVFFDFYRKISFVCCLTEDISDVKFWADYAGKGKGIAIEFNVSVERDNLFRCSKKVEYNADVPLFYTSIDDLFLQSSLAALPENWEGLFGRFSYCKSDQWRKEKEWRLIIPRYIKDTYYDQPISSYDIKAVYLGYANEKKDKIVELINLFDNKVDIYETSLKKGTYGLDFLKIN